MAKSKMMKVAVGVENEAAHIALYIRVSTDKQREEGYSVEIQMERLQAYALSMYPGKRTALYVDDGFSGGSLDRPEMTRLMEDVKGGRVHTVVVMKLDRLSRSQKDTLYLIEDVLLPHNVAFASMQESFNTATPFGRAVVGILSVFAQLERENIFERTRSGMQKRVELGFWPGGGGVPFGYDYDASTGVLVPNKDAETVRRMYGLYLEGYSMNHIAAICGLKYDKLAQQIISRKSNAGYIVYNGVEYVGKHEPIISLETYEKTMAMMLERSTRRFVSTTDHLLTGLVYCGKCGAKMRYIKWGKAGYRFMCYSQQTSKPYLIKDASCDNERPWAVDIEEIVLADLFQMAKRITEGAPTETKTMTPLELFYEQYDDLAKKLKRLYGLYASDNNEILLESIQELKDKMELLNKKIKLELERAVWSNQQQQTKEKIENLSEIWGYLSVKEKQGVLRSVIDRITATDDHIHISYQF